jgi:hypothetical protein
MLTTLLRSMLQGSSSTRSLWAAVLLCPFLLPSSMAGNPGGWSRSALRDNQLNEQPPESMPSSHAWFSAHHHLLGILNSTTMANIQNEMFGRFANGKQSLSFLEHYILITSQNLSQWPSRTPAVLRSPAMPLIPSGLLSFLQMVAGSRPS